MKTRMQEDGAVSYLATYSHRKYDMQSTHTIRFVSPTAQKQSELFFRLVADFFFAIGYVDLDSGTGELAQEFYLRGSHGIEGRQMQARCKSNEPSVGLEDIIKFNESVDYGNKVNEYTGEATKYFLSLKGFEPGLGVSQHGVHLLDAVGIIKTIERYNLLVTDAEAEKQAKECQQKASQQGLEIAGIELLVHQVGYLKAVYFSQKDVHTHVALIHSDGTPLKAELTELVLRDDKLSDNSLANLLLVSPVFTDASLNTIHKLALQAYYQRIAEECGILRLTGLPIDANLVGKDLRLKNLFIPLRAILKSDNFRAQGTGTTIQEAGDSAAIIGDILTEHRHIALLAAPGGGKSTILKRLATAYAFRDELPLIEDKLPLHELLPLFFRCRDLKTDVGKDILSLLDEMPEKMDLPIDERPALREAIHEAIREGRALLLIDGLDEIADKSAREKFANNVRRFLVAYPQTNLVITSRVEGFRLVAGVMAQVCQQATLAPFEEADVYALCERWQVEVDGPSTEVREEARALAEKICKKKGVFILAQNPLLLTTLLIVKRSIGDLPTRRAELYQKSVEILIKTWNVEGYPAMEVRETLAQLCYVACSMTQSGIKRISRSKLLKLLHRAKVVLDNELQLVEIPAEEFIDDVEYRTSLIMQTGHELDANGQAEPVYEFRHLTFQEYLAAYGYVNELHEHRDEERKLPDLLADHFHEDGWQEIIPLAIVLAGGRKADLTVQKLISRVASHDMLSQAASSYATLLGQCLLDEAVVSRDTFRAGIQQVARFALQSDAKEMLFALQQSSRVGGRTVEVVEESFAGGEPGWEEYSSAMQEINFYKLFGNEATAKAYEVKNTLAKQMTAVVQAMANPDKKSQIGTALAFASLSWGVHLATERGVERLNKHVLPEQAQELMKGLITMLESGHEPSIFAACLAIDADARGVKLLNTLPVEGAFVMLLFKAWKNAPSGSLLVEWITRALVACAPLQRSLLQDVDGTMYASFLREQVNDVTKVTGASAAKAAALMGWYWQQPWSDGELASILSEVYRFNQLVSQTLQPTAFESKRVTIMLIKLGSVGQEKLEEYSKILSQ